ESKEPAPLPPQGITHHFCRLGIISVNSDGAVESTDCRCLWPALTSVPRLFYVSGDGQEVMPDVTPDVLDDGTAEEAVGLVIGGDIICLNQFTAVPGEIITSISIAWGSS